VERPSARSSALERLRALEAGGARKAAAPAAVSQADRAPRRRGVMAGIGAAIVLVAFKLKGLLVVLLGKAKLLFVGLKLGKFAVTVWTIALMAGVYATRYGLHFAVGMVVLILIHELGHGAGARAVGVPVGAPVFVPFVGAFIAIRGKVRSRWHEFVISAAGPIAGSAAALVCVGIARQAEPSADLWLGLGVFGLVINLFNLTRFWGLDGKRMLATLSWRDAGFAVLIAAAGVVLSARAARALHPIAGIALVVAIAQVGAAAWRAHRGGGGSALARLAEAGESGPPQVALSSTQATAAVAIYGVLLGGLGALVHALWPMLRAS
jgi:Zn-dependent protease